MIIKATPTGLDLADPHDVSRLHLDAQGLSAQQLAALARSHPQALSRIDGHRAWVPAGFLATDAQAPEALAGMLDYARGKGWYDPESGQVQVHIENLGEGRHPSPDSASYRIAVVGLGAQGSGIARGLHELGHRIVGAVDIGDKVGANVGELLGIPGLSATVHGSAEALLESLEEPPQLAVIATTGSRELTIKLMKHYLVHGINVLTLHQDLFTYEPDWADELHEFCLQHGASAMGTGIQDIWWVQLPALFAAGCQDISKISYRSTLSADLLSAGIHAEIGLGLAPEPFAELVAAISDRPSVLGGPMVEAARRMGMVPGSVHHTYEPQLAGERIELAAGTIIEPGQAKGTLETVSFDTDRGIRFEGIIQVVPIAPEESCDELSIHGMPDLHIEYKPFPGAELTNNGLIARVPDIIEAAPGLHFAAELHAPRHQFPRAR